MISYYLAIFLISFFLSLAIGDPVIQLLKQIGVKQAIRELGPKDHIKKKSNTPTIGGLIFLIPLTFVVLFLGLTNKHFLTLNLAVVLCCTFAMAYIGLIDDLIKVGEKHNKGISGWFKLSIQFVLALVLFLIYKEVAGYFYLLWIFLVFAGACNSYNLTDGLDGLAATISLLSFLGITALSFYNGNTELALFSIIFMGSLLGFLFFNKYPAKVFMGDTGSIAIGAAIGTIAIVQNLELFLIPFAIIPILEALSVIIQVMYFQFYKRVYGIEKRVFKMTPLHHHFELSGWKEINIVRGFFLFQLVCVVIGIYIMLGLR